MPLVIAGLVFVAVVILVVGIWWALETSRGVRARLQGAGDVPAAEIDILRADSARSRRGLGALLSGAAPYGRLGALVAQAGYKRSAADALLVIAGFSAAAGLIGWVRTAGLIWAVIAALGAAVVPVVYLIYRRYRRLQRFEMQFPEALDMISRAIRAGNALSGAIRSVGEEMPDPLGQEFRQVSEEVQLGMEASEALSRLHTRVPIEDMGFFCAGIRIQRAAGGNLAEVLDRLAEVIRERFKILSHGRVLSAQHRCSAILVGLSPILFALIFQLLHPRYFESLLGDPMTPWLVGTGLALETIGFFIIWRLSKIEV